MDEPLRVLLVEDDEDDYLLTSELLDDGFSGRIRIDWVQSFGEALGLLHEARHDIALLDHNLGGRTGIELLREAGGAACPVPIVMLTGQSDRETDMLAMRAGAADYLVKGRVTSDLIERSIRYACERRRLLETIRSLSLSDELTGLGNRRAFFTMADQRLQLLERRRVLCLLVFADVDGLKAVNDHIGHEAGDRLLIAAAAVLRAAFRRTDLIARLGGDEFVVLADDATDEDVGLVLDRLDQHVAAWNGDAGEEFTLSISAGAVSFTAAPSVKLQELVAEADARMLRCKQQRRASRDSIRAVDGHTTVRDNPSALPT